MAHTAYAGETGRARQSRGLGMRIAGVVKRVYAALIRAREREAMQRARPYLWPSNDDRPIQLNPDRSDRL